MLNFCFLILTILEICLTVFLVKQILLFDNKIKKIHKKINIVAIEVLILNDKIIEIIKKTNKVLKFVTNKRFYQILNILKISFNTVQIILFLRSFDFKKGFNYKNIKKLFAFEIVRRFLRKVLLTSANLV